MNKSKQDGCAPRTAVDLERKYSFGQTFAEVYDLVSDARKAAEEAKQAMDNLTEEQIFNILTNYGEWQGIYRDDEGGVYINASYIKGNKISSDLIDVENLKVKHLDGGSEGEGTIVGAVITGSVFQASADVLQDEFDEAFVLLSPPYKINKETGEPTKEEAEVFAVGGIGYEFWNGYHTMSITNNAVEDDDGNYCTAMWIGSASHLYLGADKMVEISSGNKVIVSQDSVQIQSRGVTWDFYGAKLFCGGERVL